MQKIDLKIQSKKYKIVYDRKKHFKNTPYYLSIPYKDHLIVEMWGVPKNFIKEGAEIKSKMAKVVNALGLHPVSEFTHQFVPHGVTAFVILQESHLSIHTWPELNYVHMEILTCSSKVNFLGFDKTIELLFTPDYYEVSELIY